MKSLEDTKRFAEEIVSKSERRIFALVGELGSGKTTFAQFLLRALGVTEKITSPTFLIIKSYQLKAKSYQLAYHIDCYQLHNEQELLALGFADIISNHKAIVVIEWADKIKSLLPPQQTQWLFFSHGADEHERIVRMDNF